MNRKRVLLLIGIVVSLCVVFLLILILNGKKYVGTWEHYLNYVNENEEVVKQIYASYKINRNKTFSFISYNVDDSSNKREFDGTFRFSDDNNILYLNYIFNEQEYNTKLYILDKKICYDADGINCFYKSGDKIIIMSYDELD